MSVDPTSVSERAATDVLFSCARVIAASRRRFSRSGRTLAVNIDCHAQNYRFHALILNCAQLFRPLALAGSLLSFVALEAFAGRLISGHRFPSSANGYS